MISNIVKNLSNIPGWRTNRKLVVFESDDWGSIRMPSLKTFNFLSNNGLDLVSGDASRYNKNDTLASKDDLAELYHVLSKPLFKDINNNSPVFTAISLVANPDFDKIKNNNFTDYYWEPFNVTLSKYGHSGAFDMWKKGIENNLFIPQFHGREHLNVASWMRALKNNDFEARFAFDNGMWGFNNKTPQNLMYQAAFDLENPNDLSIQKEVISSGLNLFKELFGYSATFFVPPNGPFNNSLEETAAENGIKFMSASKKQIEPQGNNKYKTKFHWLGQKNKFEQYYLTRNCFFEPNQTSKDWIDRCLGDVQTAFSWKKPAVISSHRVNYVGILNKTNRENGLNKLAFLLTALKRNWPNIEFITSNQLGEIISNDK
jgi:hypothetical protein